nr:unnamed protein product [Digitaria exilis]
MCGDVEIPYPFGIGDDCSYWKGEFTLTCNHSFSPPRPYVFNMEVIDINLESGEGRVYSPVSSICYNSSNTTTEDATSWTLDFTSTPLLISSTRNEFTAIGCSTVAYIAGKEDWSFLTGCMSTCVSLHAAADDGAECTGLGCCQTDIPTNISVIEIDWSIGNGTPAVSHDKHNKRIHGDIKSGNILLDDDLNPKVSDFGSSKLVSTASRYATWLVSGDMNYNDPAYIRTGRFSEKSDVYSFGVVLLELITRKKAMYDGSNSLPINFVKTCRKEGNGRKMYDRDVLSDDAQSHSQMECLDRIGELAVQCLKEDVDDRPSMAEVLEELKQTKLTACGGSDAIV